MEFTAFLSVAHPVQLPALQRLLVLIAPRDGSDNVTAYGIDPDHTTEQDEPVFELIVGQSQVGRFFKVIADGAPFLPDSEGPRVDSVDVSTAQPKTVGPMLRAVLDYGAALGVVGSVAEIAPAATSKHPIPGSGHATEAA